MDYKTNVLTSELKMDKAMLPEINGLNFGVLSENTAVFDYTSYIEENKLYNVDYKVFMRSNKTYIEHIADRRGIKTSEMFYQNTDGHILVVSDLVFVCLSYLNPEMLIYFNNLLADIISNGIACSDGYVYSMATQRMPTEALEDIVKERHYDTAGNE